KLTEEALTLQLDCAEPMLQQAALHSYFAVPSLSDTSVSPLPGAYLDKTLGGERVQSTEPLRFEREIDRVYPKPAAELLLQSGAQQLNISQQGQDATVVWNPWQERSKTLPDLAENSYQQFVCVETAKLDLDQPAALRLSQRLTSLT
ncbi:MAG: D-hexose-6-phosphate mutarotase, partial [Alishewanella sp. 32-51-5]